ncbi:DUF6894 family protein [Bradyrhizobium sp. URHC0002]
MIGRTYMPIMARFYFDFHDADGILIDDAGEELPSAAIARKEALESIGEAVKELTSRHSEGRIAVEVRDSEGSILKVSALVETTSLKEKPPEPCLAA